MKLMRPTRLLVSALFLTLLVTPAVSIAAGNETPDARKVKIRINPSYPDLARRMNITGSVNLVVTVLPDGTVKECHAIGGHPILVEAATDAVKRWRYVPADHESTVSLMFKFSRDQ
jgi:TonB family protein